MLPLAASLDFSAILRESTAPLVLISGIGLIGMISNFRFMHVTDRLRLLLEDPSSERGSKELEALFTRARLLRASLSFLSGSMISTSALVLCVVLSHLSSTPHYIGIALLVVSVVSIAIAAALFFLDIRHSLLVLESEMKESSHVYAATKEER